MTWTPPPTLSSGDDAVVSDWNTYVRANLIELESRKAVSHVTFVAPVSISATVEASSAIIVTAGAFTANGTDTYELIFYSPNVTLPGNAAGNQLVISFFEGAAQIGRCATLARTDAGTDTRNQSVYAMHRFIPSNASHTYSVRAYRTNANCSVGGGAGSTGNDLPGYIQVRKANQ